MLSDLLYGCHDTMNTTNTKYSRFSLTSTLIIALALPLLLTLALTLALALAWLLFLRPIRLKIGDYYFKQGKFDQVVNW